MKTSLESLVGLVCKLRSSEPRFSSLLNGQFLSHEDRPRHCRNFCYVCLAPVMVSSTRTLCGPCAQMIDRVLIDVFLCEPNNRVHPREGGRGRSSKQHVFRVPALLIPAKILPLRSLTGGAANIMLPRRPFSLLDIPSQLYACVSDIIMQMH